MPRPPNFAEKTFTNSYKTSKFAQLKFSFSPSKVSRYTVSLHNILAHDIQAHSSFNWYNHSATSSKCMHGQIFYSNWYPPQPSPNTHRGPAPPRALPPLNLLQLFLVLANHICERRHILVCLLQQVCQTLVFLVVNHLTISLLILRLCEVYMHILPQ